MRSLINWITQIFAITSLNLRQLPQRWGSSAATVLGVAGVVMVFVGILSIASGFKATLDRTGDPANVLVMRSGSDTEMTSGLVLDETKIIVDAPGLLRDPTPVASAELFVIVDLPKRSTGTTANVPLRGVSPMASKVRSQFEIIQGRMFETGRNEIVAGEAAAAEFGGLEIGNILRWGENNWEVVGIFSTGGTAEDTELWTDARVLQPAYRRGSSFQSVHARLASPASFNEFKDTLTADPRLNVKVLREEEYYAEQGKFFTGFVQGLGIVIAGLMGFGAIFGALNTMYSAVASRTREIATLRALGFSSGPVVISVMVEAVALALVGGLIGGLLAYFLFNGFQAATLNFQTFSQIAFAFAVTPALLIGGLIYAALMGVVGGLLPAIRAARLPVASAFREL